MGAKLKSISKTSIKEEIINLFFNEGKSAKEITKILDRELKDNHKTSVKVDCDFVLEVIKKEINKSEENIKFKDKIKKMTIKKEMKSKFLKLYRELGFLESKDELEAKYFSFLSAQAN